MKCNNCTGLIRPVKYDNTLICEHCLRCQEQQYLTDAEIQDEIEGLRTTNGSKITPAVFYKDYY